MIGAMALVIEREHMIALYLYPLKYFKDQTETPNTNGAFGNPLTPIEKKKRAKSIRHHHWINDLSAVLYLKLVYEKPLSFTSSCPLTPSSLPHLSQLTIMHTLKT